MTTEKVKVFTGSLPPNYEKTPQTSHIRASSMPQNHDRKWSHISSKSFTSTTTNKESDIQWPAIFYRFEPDGRPACEQLLILDDHPPGLSNQFLVDPHNEVCSETMRYGQLAFPYYMAQKQLYIDIWDGDTLLHIGTSCLDLKPSLRQGKPGVTVFEDIEIIWQQYPDDAAPKMSTAAPGNNPRSVSMSTGPRSIKLGSLHTSLTNIGRTKSNPGCPTIPSMKEVSVVYDYHESAKLRLNTTHDSRKLVDIDIELHQLMQSAMHDRVAKQKLNMKKKETGEVDLSDNVKRLHKVYKLLQKDKMDIPNDIKTTEVLKISNFSRIVRFRTKNQDSIEKEMRKPSRFLEKEGKGIPYKRHSNYKSRQSI
jgi:hypothetical protein